MECLQPPGVEGFRVNMLLFSKMNPVIFIYECYRVKYILNISREIDNFYPEEFKYLNIRYVLYLSSPCMHMFHAA